MKKKKSRGWAWSSKGVSLY